MTARDPRDWLAKRAELEEAATDGPWSFTHGPNELPRIWSDALECEDEFIAKCAMKEDVPDAAFIADARTTAPAMRKALEAVLELHVRAGYRGAFCLHCQSLNDGEWPCLTVTAVTAALEPTP